MADPTLNRSRRKPPLYRLARGLRVLSTIVLVILLLFLATVFYSAYATVRNGVASNTSFTTSFGPNDTLAVSGDFAFNNGGIYPINGFTLHLLVRNGSGQYVGESTAGPQSFLPGVNQTFPFTFHLPVTANGPGASLLTQDQSLSVGIWANATFAYLFPVSIAVNSSRSWGAPFAEFTASVGTPFTVGSTVKVPVTIMFQNHASFADAGTFASTVLSVADQNCGGGTFAVNVPAGQPYSQTTDIALASGCNPSGGTVATVYTDATGASVTLPTEPIP